MRARRVLAVWTGVVALGWLFVGAGWAENEANCNEATSFICFSRGEVWLMTSVFAACIWIAGLAVIGLVAWLVWLSRRVDHPSRTDGHG